MLSLNFRSRDTPPCQFPDFRLDLNALLGQTGTGQTERFPVGNSGAHLQIFMPSTGHWGRAARPMAASVLAYFMENRAW